tara:strand:+ start:10551 stop:11723 length:1173 start_codon:yes stop_codon:yes gene_type:complete
MPKFNPKDASYKNVPKTASPKSPNEPGEYEDHSYNHREVRPDGATVYYYDNGVKAIHHPKKTGATYHRRAAEHHKKEADKAVDSKKSKSALSHLKARLGHLLAADDKDSKVEKLYKDFGGAESGASDIVAVASDPGIFTNTYSGTNTKKNKSKKNEVEENKKNKKKASGPDKLDKWLKDTEEKTLHLFDLTKSDPAPKYDKGRTGGLTPDHNVKTSLEERDMESWMEAREKNAEDRAFGLKKTKQLSAYVVDLINDVRKELDDESPKYVEQYADQSQEEFDNQLEAYDWLTEQIVNDFKKTQIDFRKNPEKYNVFVKPNDESMEKMETDWSKTKKDDKLTNMPFLNHYKKSIEGRRENPPIVEKQYGTKRSPRPDPNGHRNPPNRRIPKD